VTERSVRPGVAAAKGGSAAARLDAEAGASHVEVVVAGTGAIDRGPHEPFEFGMPMFGLRIQ
jgi:hypothetical protein